MADSRRLRQRLERVKEQSRSVKPGQMALAASTVRRQRAPSLFGRLEAGLSPLVPRAAALRLRLDQAGISRGVIDVIAICLVAGGLSAAVPVIVLGASWAVGCGSFILGGLGVPHWLISSRGRQRRRRFVKHFPDAIDLIVRGVKSGLPVMEAINTASQEAHPLVAEVFRDVSGNIRLGMMLDRALWQAAKKLDIQEFRFFVISLSIQQETGGNLAEILANLSQMMRRRDQLLLKIKAISSEAKASAYIIGSLPFIMFVLLLFVNRAYVLRLVEDPRGWILLGIGGTSLGIGVGVMAKMVRFEI